MDYLIGDEQQSLSFDKKKDIMNWIIENKVGHGKYQKRALLYLSLIDFNDGLELIIMSIINPII